MEENREGVIGKPVPPVPGCQATNPDWRKMPRNRPDKDEKHLAYSILIANGVQKEKAATMLGYSAKTVRSIDRALKEKGLKLVLLSEQRIQRAHRVVDKILAGRTFGSIETVRASDSLRAAEVVLNRSDPVREAAPPVPRLSFVQINLDSFRTDRHLDAHPTTTRLDDSDAGPVSEPLDVAPTTEPDPTTSGNGSQPPES